MQDQVILHRLPARRWVFPPFLQELQASPLWGRQKADTRIPAPSWYYLLEAWVSKFAPEVWVPSGPGLLILQEGRKQRSIAKGCDPLNGCADTGF